MSGNLTERQKDELHKSILSYLHSSNLLSSYEALKLETGNEDFDPADAEEGRGARWKGLLEKKWTSVVRLQKKIMDLESRLSSLSTQLLLPRSLPTSSTWLPAVPHTHTLSSHRSPVTALAFHPVWNVVVSAGEDCTLKVWDWETGELERTLKGHTRGVGGVDFDERGEMMVTCSNDMSLKLWSPSLSYTNTKTLQGHTHSVSAVLFLPGHSSRFILSASRDKSIKVWDSGTGYCTRTWEGHADWVRCLAGAEGGRWVASGGSDQTIMLWDFQSPENTPKLTLRGHEHVVECVEFAPVSAYANIRELAGLTVRPGDERAKQPGCFVVSGSRDKTIRLWDAQSGQCLRVFTGHDNWIRALTFHPSGTHLLSASDDKTVRIWDLKTGRMTRVVEAHEHFVSCLKWGRVMVGGGAGKAKEGKEVNGKAGEKEEGEGRRVNVLATGSVDCTVRIWMP